MQRPHGRALRRKSKVPPVAHDGPRSGQNLPPSPGLTPAKPTPPRPEGPEHPRFKRDVVTSQSNSCRMSRGKLAVHARKRLTALTRRYSPSAAPGLDGLTPTAHINNRNGFKRVRPRREWVGTGRTFQTAAADAGHDAPHQNHPFQRRLASPCRFAASWP